MTASVGGGQSNTHATTQSSGETGPWAPTVPYYTNPQTGLLTQVGTLDPNDPRLMNPDTGATAFQYYDAAHLRDQANALGEQARAYDISGNVNKFLTGDPYNLLQSGLSNYQQQLSPYLDPANLDPFKNPATAGIIDQIRTLGTQNVDSMFAGAGRDLSGLNTAADTKFFTESLAPTMFGQYNTNVSNLLGSAGNLFNANQNTSQNMSANVGAGMGMAAAQPGIQLGPTQMALAASNALSAIPWQNMGQKEALLNPMAGLGNTNINTSVMDSATNSMNWGLSGGAGSLGGMGSGKSDIRLKRDIVPVGRYKDFKLYKFRYLDDDQVYVGVMAQEVQEIDPDAVEIGEDGFMRVKYNRLGMRLLKEEEWDAQRSF